MAGGGGGGGMSRWLITYADLITLLMVFFVVMFAMANIDKQKYARLAMSLNAAFGGSGLVSLPGEDTGLDTPTEGFENLLPHGQAGVRPGSDEADALVRLGETLASALKPYGRFHVYVSARGLTISLTGSALFDTGQARIRPDAEPVLAVIARNIKDLPNDISVEGSADDRPIHTPEFPSNWELSARRATEVVRHLVTRHGLDPRRFIAVGYAEQRPLFDNATEEGRARNRRVDIVILRDRYRVELGRELGGD